MNSVAFVVDFRTAPFATSSVMLLCSEIGPETKMPPAGITTLQPKAELDPEEQLLIAA
jgi:hypothetical protein